MPQQNSTDKPLQDLLQESQSVDSAIQWPSPQQTLANLL